MIPQTITPYDGADVFGVADEFILFIILLSTAHMC